jgi:integrase
MPRIALTDRFCAGAKAEGGQIDFFDSYATGLALRVAPSGRKVWTFHFTSPRDGKRSRHTLGPFPAITLAAARGQALGLRQQVEEGADPRGAAAKGAADLTFGDLANIFLADPEKEKLRSIKEIRRRLTRNAFPIIGGVKLGKLTRRDVRDVIEPIQKRGATVHAEHTFKDIRAILRWGIRHDYLDSNPVDGMDAPGGGSPRERTLSDDEINSLWNGLPKALAKTKSIQRIVKLILVTGQRSGEIAGMARSEFDLQRRLWLLPGNRTKNAHPHTVPLSDLALAIIREAMADSDSDYLFSAADGGSLSSQAVARTIGRANETSDLRPQGRFGIAPWSAHDLRRTALTGMARLGITPHVIGHVANHRSITKGGITFAHYIWHSYEAEKRHALALWSDGLTAIVGSGGAAVVRLQRWSSP